MRAVPWNRQARIREVRDELFRVVSMAAEPQEVLLQAAALLQLPASDVAVLARLHFLLSDELGQLTEELPSLTRHLATSSAQEEEWHPERIRGPVQWGRTLSARGASGNPSAFVTVPARRAFQTPENELLVAVLDAVDSIGRDARWQVEAPAATFEEDQRREGVRQTIQSRLAAVGKWRQARALAEVERVRPTPRSLHRVRTGRRAQRYASTLAAYERWQSLVVQSDRRAVMKLVEEHALVTRDDATLFELLVLFQLKAAIEDLGWRFEPLRLVYGTATFKALAGSGDVLSLWYQYSPRELAGGRPSRYVSIAAAHGLSVGELRPDAVIHWRRGEDERWLVVEMKMSEQVAMAPRRALADLLAYQAAFLHEPDARVFWLGVAWGSDLRPQSGKLMLCTPDKIRDALTAAGLGL